MTLILIQLGTIHHNALMGAISSVTTAIHEFYFIEKRPHFSSKKSNHFISYWENIKCKYLKHLCIFHNLYCLKYFQFESNILYFLIFYLASWGAVFPLVSISKSEIFNLYFSNDFAQVFLYMLIHFWLFFNRLCKSNKLFTKFIAK